MMKNYPLLERRKVLGSIIQEVYIYFEEDKHTFLSHYKEMRKRGFKNDRATDLKIDELIYVTYNKEMLKK